MRNKAKYAKIVNICFIQAFFLLTTGCGFNKGSSMSFEDVPNQLEKSQCPPISHEQTIEWNEEFKANKLTCTVNTKITLMPSAPLAKVEIDPFTIYEIRKYAGYVFGSESILIDTIPYSESVNLKAGQVAALQADENSFIFQKDLNSIIQLENWVLRGNGYPGEPKGTKLNNVIISKKAAIDELDKIIAELDIQNCTLSSAVKARQISAQNEILSEGWYISYYLSVSEKLKPLDIFYTSGSGDMIFSKENSTGAPWLPQRIDCYIDEHGIQYFRFLNRIRLIHVEETESLLPFDKIKQIFKNLINTGYSHFESNRPEDQPYIKEVFLTTCTVSSNTSANSTTVVPIWVALISNQYYDDNYFDPYFIAVNAVTGAREIVEVKNNAEGAWK